MTLLITIASAAFVAAFIAGALTGRTYRREALEEAYDRGSSDGYSYGFEDASADVEIYVDDVEIVNGAVGGHDPSLRSVVESALARDDRELRGGSYAVSIVLDEAPQ